MIRRYIFVVLSLSIFLVAGLKDFETIQKAKEAYNNKEYTKSIANFKELDGNSPEVGYDIANSYYKEKQYDKAIEMYKSLKDIDQHDIDHNIVSNYMADQDK